MLREEGIDNIHLAYKTCYAGASTFKLPATLIRHCLTAALVRVQLEKWGSADLRNIVGPTAALSLHG